MQQEFEFTIAFDDFDASLLPADARTPGSEAFIAGIREIVAREFGGHGGWARIVADEKARRLTVTWGAGNKGYDPLASRVRRESSETRGLRHGSSGSGTASPPSP